MTPRISPVRRDDTHRLIPSRHSQTSVLERLTDRAGDLPDLFELEGATNDRLLGEAGLPFTFDDYLADFRADFHDLRGNAAIADCLDPKSDSASQRLAVSLLAAGSAGVVYPSPRRAKGTCLACFRPALVTNVRAGGTVTILR